MNRKNFLIIVFVAILIAISLGYLIYYKVIIKDIYEIDMYLEVADVTGVNVDTDAIYFGRVKPGDGITKKIMIQNSVSAQKIELITKSDFNNWLSFERIINIEPKEEKEISITVNVPQGAEQGQYKGKLKIYFYR